MRHLSNTWLERTMLGVTSLAEGKRRAARPPLSHTVRRAGQSREGGRSMRMVIGAGCAISRHQSVLALWLIVAILVLMTTTATAEVIDFETIPGGEPTAGLVISDQFESSYGVRFSVSDSADLVLGDYGGEFQGWVDDSLAEDVLQPGYDRGEFFAVIPEAETPGRYLIIE